MRAVGYLAEIVPDASGYEGVEQDFTICRAVPLSPPNFVSGY
jgi:hypothetical protein